MDAREAETILTRAEDLLDEGRALEALDILRALGDDDPDRWLLTVAAWTDLGDWDRAEPALAELHRTCAPDEPLADFYEGRLRLVQWRPAAARTLFARVPGDVGGPSLLADCALLEDMEGRHEAADTYFAQAHALHPELVPLPTRLSATAFRALVHEAAGELPEEFRAALDTMAVVIDPMPTAAIVGAPESGHPPDILGLFVGLPLHENGARGHGEMPPTIFLFQRNLERVSPDESVLREEVRITLYHELAHALGFDEEGVDDMGLG